MTSLEKEMARREKRKSDVLIAAQSLDNEIQSVKDLKRLSIGSMDLVTDPELEFRMSGNGNSARKNTIAHSRKRKTWTPDSNSLNTSLLNSSEDDTSCYFSFTEDSESSLLSNSSLETTKAEYLHDKIDVGGDEVVSMSDRKEANYNDRKRALLLTRRRLSGVGSMKQPPNFNEKSNGGGTAEQQHGNSSSDADSVTKSLLWVPANQHPSVRPEGYIELVQNTLQGIHFDDRGELSQQEQGQEQADKENIVIIADESHEISDEDIMKQRNVKRQPSKLRRSYTELDSDAEVYHNDELTAEQENAQNGEKADNEGDVNSSNSSISTSTSTSTSTSIFDRLRKVSLRDITEELTKISNKAGLTDNDAITLARTLGISGSFFTPTSSNRKSSDTRGATFADSTTTNTGRVETETGTGVETLAEEDTYASNIVMSNEGSTSQRSSLRRSKFNTYRIRTNSTKSVNLHPVRRSSTNVQEQEQRQEPLCVVPDGSLAPAVSTTANQSQQLYNNEYNQQGDEASTSRDRIIKTFLPRNEGSRETFNSAEEELGKNGVGSDQQRESEEPSQRELSSGNKLPWLGRSRSRTNSGKFSYSSTQQDIHQQQQQQQLQQDTIPRKESFEEKFIKLFRRKSHSPVKKNRTTDGYNDRDADSPTQREIKKRISKFQGNTRKYSGISDNIRPEQLIPAHENGLKTYDQGDITAELGYMSQQQVQGQIQNEGDNQWREAGAQEEEEEEEELATLQPAVSVTSTKNRAFMVSGIYSNDTVPNDYDTQNNHKPTSGASDPQENEELDNVYSYSSTSSEDAYQDAVQEISNGEIQGLVGENTICAPPEDEGSEITQEQYDEGATDGSSDRSSNDTVLEKSIGEDVAMNMSTAAVNAEDETETETEAEIENEVHTEAGVTAEQSNTSQQPTVTSTLPPRKLTFADVKRPERANAPMQFTDSAFGFPLPALTTSTVIMFDYRLNINVERAIYRLSHLKLSDPKRELRQQVLLSNFMYAYLNLVNHTLYMEQFATNEKTEAEDHGDEEDISEEYKDVDISDSLEDETSLEVHDEDTFQYNDVGNDMTGGMGADSNNRNYTYGSGSQTEYVRKQSMVPDYPKGENSTNGAILIPEV